jgi:hypothetical protein
VNGTWSHARFENGPKGGNGFASYTIPLAPPPISASFYKVKDRLQCFMHHIENICTSHIMLLKLGRLDKKVTKPFDASSGRSYTPATIASWENLSNPPE